jgi:hypothetical protein
MYTISMELVERPDIDFLLEQRDAAAKRAFSENDTFDGFMRDMKKWSEENDAVFIGLNNFPEEMCSDCSSTAKLVLSRLQIYKEAKGIRNRCNEFIEFVLSDEFEMPFELRPNTKDTIGKKQLMRAVVEEKKKEFPKLDKIDISRCKRLFDKGDPNVQAWLYGCARELVLNHGFSYREVCQ